MGLTAAEWQIAGRKNWNWGEKNLGIRDDKVLAEELLAEPDVAALSRACGRCRRSGSRSSATRSRCSSTGRRPRRFVPIVTAMFARENPKVEFRQFQGGGLTSTRAYTRFYADVVAWKPDMVLLVVINRTDEDLAELRDAWAAGFAAAGARVLTFDDVHDPDAARPRELREGGARSRETRA